MTKTDGGQAFPSEGEGHGNPHYHSSGMTLRDYFAAKAMTCVRLPQAKASYERLASESYALADAMIAERDKP